MHHDIRTNTYRCQQKFAFSLSSSLIQPHKYKQPTNDQVNCIHRCHSESAPCPSPRLFSVVFCMWRHLSVCSSNNNTSFSAQPCSRGGGGSLLEPTNNFSWILIWKTTLCILCPLQTIFADGNVCFGPCITAFFNDLRPF